MKKLVTTLCTVIFLAAPSQATFLNLTKEGLADFGIVQGNQGTVLEVDILQISALTRINQPDGHLTDTVFTVDPAYIGTVFLDKKKGLGVRTFCGGGSKGISGAGPDQDEALVFDFTDQVWASSITLGLNSYQQKSDDPVITLVLSGGNELVFYESDWTVAVTPVTKNQVTVDLGLLIDGGPYENELVKRLYVMEPCEHIYVNAIAYEIPEPATIALLGLGCLLLCRPKKSS